MYCFSAEISNVLIITSLFRVILSVACSAQISFRKERSSLTRKFRNFQIAHKNKALRAQLCSGAHPAAGFQQKRKIKSASATQHTGKMVALN
jgi:hypothetical protein